MKRERALKVGLVLVGLLFSAAIFPLIGGLRDPAHSDTGDTMMMSLYFALGVFLLIAVRNPSGQRSVIAFAAWSSFAHAVTMSIQAFEMPSERTGFLIGSGMLVVIGVVLIALAPPKQPIVIGQCTLQPNKLPDNADRPRTPDIMDTSGRGNR